LLTRVFYSFQDTKTPVSVAVISVIFNVILSFIFIWILSFPNFIQTFTKKALDLQGIENIGVVGLSFALGLSGILNFVLLFYLLWNRIKKTFPGVSSTLKYQARQVYYSLSKILLNGGLMGVFVILTLRIIAPFVNMKTVVGISLQGLSAVLVGGLIYIFLAFLLRSPELPAIKDSLKKQFN